MKAGGRLASPRQGLIVEVQRFHSVSLVLTKYRQVSKKGGLTVAISISHIASNHQGPVVVLRRLREEPLIAMAEPKVAEGDAPLPQQSQHNASYRTYTQDMGKLKRRVDDPLGYSLLSPQ